jgi:hypothetical protein
MPFNAECPFCRVIFRGVPSRRLGESLECPRCGNAFTLAAMLGPIPAQKPKSITKVVLSTNGSVVAVQTAEPVVSPTTTPPTVEIPSAPVVTVVQAPAPAAPPAFRVRRRNDFGVASFVSGSVAMLTAALPYLNVLTLPLSLIGAGLGVAGIAVLSARRRGVGYPALGLTVSLLALVLPVAVPSLFSFVPWTGADKLPPVPAAPVVFPLRPTGLEQHVQAGENEWVNASREAVHVGSARVRVLSAAVQSLDTKEAQRVHRSREKYLVLTLRISNAGGARLIAYSGWGASLKAEVSAPVLRDDGGRTYRLAALPAGAHVPGQVSEATIPPGKIIEDTLVFQPPSAKVKFLHLELPAQACGGTGQLRLEIPRSMLQYR